MSIVEAEATKMVDVATYSGPRVFRHSFKIFCVSWFYLAVITVPLSFFVYGLTKDWPSLKSFFHWLSLQSIYQTLELTENGLAGFAGGGCALVLAILQTFVFIRTSFLKNCYFRAGLVGIAINLPQYRLFTYRLVPQQFSWRE